MKSTDAVIEALRQPWSPRHRRPEPLISERPTTEELNALMERVLALAIEADSVAIILERLPLPEQAMMRRVQQMHDAEALLKKAQSIIEIYIGG